MAKCEAPITASTRLVVYDPCTQTEFTASPEDLGLEVVAIGCDEVSQCPVIIAIQNSIQDINTKDIDQDNKITNNATNIVNLQTAVAAINIRDDGQDARFNDINTNITSIKGNILVIQGDITSMKADIQRLLESGLGTHVIQDDGSAGFSQWLVTTYIPNPHNYYVGDFYINTNTEEAYIHNGSYNGDGTDWVKIPGGNNLITIKGTLPIEVTKSGSEYTISINAENLKSLIEGFDTLDLSNVDVTLGDVLGDVTFKGNVTIEGTTTLNDFTFTGDTGLSYYEDTYYSGIQLGSTKVNLGFTLLVSPTANVPTTINHALDSTRVTVTAYDMNLGEEILVYVSNRTPNSIDITSTTTNPLQVIIKK